ncbi:hypothetical protein [Streptomyces cinnamoneus]|uniref:Lipoprotein n=1 Tax=Streptomyces cinnamoneus TaxID=53446 RepID=A0A918WFK5_STRCJ|nr:hypothetical protein [Streptomyces cinnamoneus]GHC38964.1 putative lipoprotein [Streptomyces cinnamoneus]
MKAIRKSVMMATSAALAMGLAACGGHDTKASDVKDGSSARPGGAAPRERADAPTVLKAAMAKMAQQNSYRTVETAKTGHEPDSRAEMVFQNEPEASEVKTADTHMVSVGGASYMATEDVPGKSWFVMDEPGSRAGKPAALPSTTPSTPPKENAGRRVGGSVKKWVGALLAASKDLKRVGGETVGGRATDHYRGTVVLADLKNYEGPAMTKDYRDLYLLQTGKAGMEKPEIDVWVDKDGFIAKEEEKGRTPKGDERITEEFSGFGADPKIKAPDPKDVATWSEYVAAGRKNYRTHS